VGVSDRLLGGGLQAYVARRVVLALPVLFGVSVLVFGVLHLAPGDPAAIMLGAQATREDVERLRRDLGLDQPLTVQYLRWLTHVLRGDLGRSIPLGREVLPEVLLRFKATLILTAGALVVAVAIGVPAGILSATRQYTWIDKLAMGVAVTGVSLPVFWTGIMLIIVFALTLQWFPSAGMTSPYGSVGPGDVLWHLVLPAVTLGTASAAALARMTRSSILEIIRQDYVRAARAKGLGEPAVVLRHVLKNAVNPIITVLGLQVGFLLGGAILTETVFSWPGLGSMMVRAIQARDYPLVQGGVLLIATTFVLVNLLVDLLYALFDPRIRYE
jgi:ABC-type dipeptide/oligopeptide/nickel transport system permease component